ncbi:MAG: FAD-binding oxidoreductase [Bacteroidales bacterium]|nr:FAD-binding oxidoreductase [Bacteroidales bacterium]
MTEYIVKIQHIERITHDVKRFRVEKPAGYTYTPGQATGVAINSAEIRKKRRSFTFTGLNEDPYLEFTIKIYPGHNGLTMELDRLVPGDELVIGNPWGAITYKGKGVFIAGGAGITPFLAIFRDLHRRNEIPGNKLIFANKTRADIILGDELSGMLGEAFISILSREKVEGYGFGHISEEILREQIDDFNTNFYLCGPPSMMESMTEILSRVGVDRKAVTMDM